MFHWFTQALASATASLTFFTIFLVGVVFSAFSLLLGGHGDAGHDADHDMGHDAGHEHDGGAGDHDGGAFSVGMLSVRGVALLSTGFGGIGFLVYTATGKMLFSSAAALVFGYIFAFIVLYTLKIFKSQQANSLIGMDSAIGGEAVVTVSIPQDGMGEVSLSVSGMEMFKPARSIDGVPIRTGMRVQVSRVIGGTLVVAAVPSSLQPSETRRS